MAKVIEIHNDHRGEGNYSLYINDTTTQQGGWYTGLTFPSAAKAQKVARLIEESA